MLLIFFHCALIVSSYPLVPICTTYTFFSTLTDTVNEFTEFSKFYKNSDELTRVHLKEDCYQIWHPSIIVFTACNEVAAR